MIQSKRVKKEEYLKPSPMSYGSATAGICLIKILEYLESLPHFIFWFLLRSYSTTLVMICSFFCNGNFFIPCTIYNFHKFVSCSPLSNELIQLK